MSGLTQALVTALTGLQANQTSLALVSSNVANADTPGYTRKVASQTAIIGDGLNVSVRVTEIQRQLDQYVQRQLRVENSGASYAATRSQLYSELQDVYGQPGSDNALETVYNQFTSALQALTTSPDDSATRAQVIDTAQALAQQLNQMSDSVQALRNNAELGIADAVTQVNDALSQIASLNQKIMNMPPDDSATATLMDQRDAYIDKLSQFMDINVIAGDHNQVSVFTNSGVQLAGAQASQLSFDARGTITPESQWSADPTQRMVGTITLTTPAGNTLDLIQNGSIRSGTIAAYVQMRDQDLVAAQNQLDTIAATLSSALSDVTTAGSAVTAGAQNGFDVDIGSLS